MLRNIIGFVVGYLVGSAVNFALIMANLLFMPAGTDFSTPEGVNAAMANLQPLNYGVVFFAHALGTFVGAFIATKIALSHRFTIAMVIGVLFLLGGIYAAWAIAAPMWFEATDLLLAYIPTAFLAAKLAGGTRDRV